MRILVVEDDLLVAKTLEVLFSANNYSVDLSFNAENASQMIEAFEYDLIVLDVLLPGINGIDLCQQLRSQGYPMPILLLTGQNDTQQKAIALNHGADDYVVKPFDPEELIARVQALLRRGSTVQQATFTWGNLQLNPISHTATYGSQPLSLTPKEFAILELFLRNSQRILSSKAILEHAWTASENPGEETVRVHIKELRRKLGMAGAPNDFIETLYRVGYHLKPLESQELSPSTPITSPPTQAKGRPQRGRTLFPQEAKAIALLTTQPELGTQIQALLERDDLQVVVINDVDHLWTIAATCTPQMFLLDSQFNSLPGKSSLDLCQQIRLIPTWQGLPILILLQHLSPQSIEAVFVAGASDFVSYPVVEPELMARTRIWLRASTG